MNKILYREGPQPPEYWRQWRNQVRYELRHNTPWEKGRAVRESLEGVATQPVNFPCYEDEIQIFPRNIDIRHLVGIINHPERRKREYEQRMRMVVNNFNSPGRGLYTFLILPQTFERIIAQIEMRQTKIAFEAQRVAKEYYYKGRRAHEVDSQITIRTLTEYLRAAEEDLDILGAQRGTLLLATRTLDTSYTILRYAREEQLDFRRYFKNRIF